MAISDALAWRLANGGTASDLYSDINNFLATNPTAEQTQAAMAQYGISPQDVAAATGGASGGLLSGNIMAGASWNSTNTALQNALTEATGQQTSNYAVGGSTTTDTLNQLNKFLAGGGQFDPNATVYLQAGGVDFITGVDKAVVKDNLNQIVKTLGDQGVNVVLTGSPYAASVQDVVNNNFDPKVDQIFVDVAKANPNVALVGTQGEILQNKKLLVDALHTNAEGTAIYNQSVIDALSQFKNEVPPSTPQAIAEVQKTNTVATTPPVITQASSSPATAQALIRTTANTRGGVIEGDNIDEQIANLPEMMYMTRTNPDNPAIWETYNPKTGEIVNTGTFAGGGDQGLLRAAAPVIGLAASTVGLPFISNLIGGATGLTGSALSGATGAAIGGGTQAITGGSTQDVLRGALLGGSAGYLGKELTNYLASRDVPVDFANMTSEQIADATETNFINDLKRAGLTNAQIDDFMTNSGGTEAIRQIATSTPTTDAGTVSVTAPASLSNVIGTIAATTPVNAGTVNVKSTPQQVDQAVMDLINSQIQANTKVTPVQTITGNKPTTAQDVVNAITSTLPINSTQQVAQQTITGSKPATTQEIVNAITATLPTISSVQANNIAEQVVTSGKPVTTQDVINAITATLPVTTATTPVATQTITGNKPATTQDIVNAIIATTPITVPTVNTPNVTVVGEKPSSITDAVTAATIPLIQPSTPLTVTPVTSQQTTPVDPLKVAQLGLTAAGLLGAGSALSNNGTGGTQYPIVPIPESWATPPATKVAPATILPPIDFGTRNLLIGTQWEKFLDPNYGKVPEPVQFAQPSNLSYSDLMGILGSKQGMPSRSSLSINDVISGIQNQYGQA